MPKNLTYPVAVEVDRFTWCIAMSHDALDRAVAAALGDEALPFKVVENFSGHLIDCLTADGYGFTLSHKVMFV